MSDSDYLAGLQEAHRLLAEHQKRLEREYRNAPGAFFGLFPSERQLKIIGASDALVNLGFELVKARERCIQA